ncbi:MAG: leucine-rich repeat protein [Muribaculaceae bacterium]|nr:leucine-rich repeat protein [Muribaculaceae bacterium]
MATKMKQLILLMALLMSSQLGYASVMIGDLAYNLEGDHAIVTYTEEWSNNNYSGLTAANIPKEVNYEGKTYKVTQIGYCAFLYCRSLTSVTIPNTVTSIGYNGFSGCSSLTELTLSDSITDISGEAFCWCSALKKVIIPNTTQSIGYRAFAYCYSLTSLTIGKSVKSISTEAFYNCTGLTEIEIPASVNNIANDAFNGCNNINSVIWNAKKCIGQGVHTFSNKKAITSFIFGNEVEKIPDYLCNSLTGITNIIIPNSVTTIGRNAFYNCTGLNSITLPNSIKEIGDEAFSACINLTSVTIPNSVASIGGLAFSGCTGLMNIHSKIQSPQDVQLGEKVFNEVPNIACVLHVPAGTKSAYLASPQWNNFLHIEENDDVNALSLSINQIELAIGEKVKLGATLLPADATTSIAWLSSNEDVAIVKNGLVTAKNVGEATISAITTDSNNLKSSFKVHVIEGKGINGDINNDGDENIQDVTILINHILGIK